MSAISVSANWLDGANGDEAEASRWPSPSSRGRNSWSSAAAAGWGARPQPVGCEELDNERRVDHGTTAAEPVDALEKLVDVRDTALQQVAASFTTCEERGRVLDLDVGREDEDRDLRELLSNGLSGPEAFGGKVRRHPDVDDRNIGSMLTDEAEKLGRVGGLSDHAVAGLCEKTRDPLAEKEVVVGDDDGPGCGLGLLLGHAPSMARST